MSAGPGRLQNAILSRLRVDGETTLESLRWDLWFDSEGGECDLRGSIDQKLRPAWNNKIRGAVDGLVRRQRLVVEKRPVAGIAEFQRHYPNKSLWADVRLIRKELIPVLFEWCEYGDGPPPRYGVAENENFQWKQMLPKDRQNLASEWSMIESGLLQLACNLAGPERDHIFLLCCKGKSIFVTSEVACRSSFGALVDRCASVLPPELYTRVKAIAEAIMDAEKGGLLRVKSFIHTFADIPRRGARCSLRDQTVDFLETSRPDILHTLPGYRAVARPERKASRPYEFAVGAGFCARPTQSPKLERLFDHKAFQEFSFLHVAG